MDIKRSGMCGNSPKSQLAEDLAVALLTGDTETLRQRLTEAASITVVGSEQYSKTEVLEGAASIRELDKLAIDQALSHGKVAAVSGSGVTAEGQRFAFSDHYTFANTKATEIASVTSFRIMLPNDANDANDGAT